MNVSVMRRSAAALLGAWLVMACGGPIASQEPAAGNGGGSDPSGGPSGGSGPVSGLAAEVQICEVPNPHRPSSAFDVTKSKEDRHGDYYVTWQCREPCPDWRECYVEDRSVRGAPRRALAFVVDGMGGHVAYSTGDKTVLLHGGMGGTSYPSSLARAIEERSDVGTVMVRWESGFRGWGWFTRTSAEASRIPAVTRRVAAVIAWVHEHVAGPGAFGTAGCSMGTQATFGAAYWHEEVDRVVDYQLFSGGPGLWDINAGCGLRVYESGHCDLDAGAACNADSDCAGLGAGSRCDMPRPIPNFRLYQQVVNHVHATQACAIPRQGAVRETYAPFDESGFVRGGGDWDIDHPVDFAMDVRGRDGDENWALGDTMRVFNDVESAAGHEKRWRATPGSNHCAALNDGTALEMILARMAER